MRETNGKASKTMEAKECVAKVEQPGSLPVDD